MLCGPARRMPPGEYRFPLVTCRLTPVQRRRRPRGPAYGLQGREDLEAAADVRPAFWVDFRSKFVGVRY